MSPTCPIAVEPASDCRPLSADQLTQDSELYWMALDGSSHLQICDPGDAGGWGSWNCEQIPARDLRGWFGDPNAAADQLAALGLGDDGRVEMCWPDSYPEAIQRSLVADDTLWTMTPSALQANRLVDLGVVTQLALR